MYVIRHFISARANILHTCTLSDTNLHKQPTRMKIAHGERLLMSRFNYTHVCATTYVHKISSPLLRMYNTYLKIIDIATVSVSVPH